ncbi:methyltransferase type 11 [Mycolicibacterium phlei]
MVGVTTPTVDIARMPRGGPDASCLDRLLDRLGYLDRSDVDPDGVIRALDWTGGLFGSTERFAEIALAEVAEVADPRILELGDGHGALARTLLDWHPTAQVTVTDLAGAAQHADGDFDLAVSVLALHHLPPERAARLLGEGTRVADRLLIIDLPRPPSPLHVLRLATMLPLAPVIPLVHDGVISSLRTYSPSALRALAEHAGVDVELRGGPLSPQIVVATRR